MAVRSEFPISALCRDRGSRPSGCCSEPGRPYAWKISPGCSPRRVTTKILAHHHCRPATVADCWAGRTTGTRLPVAGEVPVVGEENARRSGVRRASRDRWSSQFGLRPTGGLRHAAACQSRRASLELRGRSGSRRNGGVGTKATDNLGGGRREQGEGGRLWQRLADEGRSP